MTRDTRCMGEPQVEEISADFARRWWKSLMANAVALVEDAHALADRGSAGRAQALLVLAMEEVAKARWLYEAAEWEWVHLWASTGRNLANLAWFGFRTAYALPSHHMQKSCRATLFSEVQAIAHTANPP